MNKASLSAAFAALIVLGSAAVSNAAQGSSIEEQRLLGQEDEEAAFLALLPFTREKTVSGEVSGSLAASLARMGVPAATTLGALRAFATAIAAGDLQDGDRFYLRYVESYAAQGTPIGVGHVLWAELRSATKGTIAIHRFRRRDNAEHFWLVNGQKAAPPAMRLPLETVAISSGFGMRADPFDKRPPVFAARPGAVGKASPQGGPKQPTLPPGLPTGGATGSASGSNGRLAIGMNANAAAWYSSLGPVPTVLRPGQPPGQPNGRATSSLMMHAGVDLVAAIGTPILAAADGVVAGAAPNGGYGNWIRIDHAGQLATVYGHLSAFAPGIGPGSVVTQGEVIGFVGSTGRSTGAHVHFEVLANGRAVNPINHPELKPVSLRGADLERFQKQVARSLEEREREARASAKF